MRGAASSWKLGTVSISSPEQRKPQSSWNRDSARSNSTKRASRRTASRIAAASADAKSCASSGFALQHPVADHRPGVGEGGVVPLIAADVKESPEVVQQGTEGA